MLKQLCSGVRAKNILKWGIPMEIQPGEINKIKNAEGGCWVRQEMNTLWRLGTPLREGKCGKWVRSNCATISSMTLGTILLYVLFLMKCAFIVLMLLSGWGSLPWYYCHLSFPQPTKLKYSNVMGQWDKKENQTTLTCYTKLNLLLFCLQYTQVRIAVPCNV